MSDSYFGDVLYRVWMDGGNPDAVSRDRIETVEYGGGDADEAACMELRLQRARAQVERDMREWEANELNLPDDERFCR